MPSPAEPGNCSVCTHPQRVEIDALLFGGASTRKVEAWTASDGNGPKVSFNTVARHKRHLPIPAESLSAREGIPRSEVGAAFAAKKAKVHAAQVETAKQNPAFPAAVAAAQADLDALAETRDFCLDVLRGHKAYQNPKKDISQPTVRLMAVAVLGVRTTAKTRFDILHGKSKPGDGQQTATNVQSGLAGLLGGAFDEGPPPLFGDTDPDAAKLADLAMGDTLPGTAPPGASPVPVAMPPGASPTPDRIPTSDELWDGLLPSAPTPANGPSPVVVPPPPGSGTTRPSTSQGPGHEAPAPTPAPTPGYGQVFAFPPRVRQG